MIFELHPQKERGLTSDSSSMEIYYTSGRELWLHTFIKLEEESLNSREEEFPATSELLFVDLSCCKPNIVILSNKCKRRG